MKAALLAASLLLCALVVLWPQSPSAIPAFARHYGTNCTMCHSSFPRLNDFGVRFRDNGYRMPGLEDLSTTVLEGPPPFAARTSAGIDITRDGGSDSNRFQVNALDLLSGGLISDNIGYLFIYPPYIPNSLGTEGQSGDVEMANIIFSELGASQIHLRVGRFEPAYVAFSAKRQLSASPYEIYEFAQPGGEAISQTQDGLELTAVGLGPVSLALGYVDGVTLGPLDDVPADLYLRAAGIIGAGEGQTAGQRIGLTGHVGQMRPDGLVSNADREVYYRLGLDASFNIAQANLALQALWGHDPAALWEVEDDVDVFGGFVEASGTVLTRWLLLARFDAVITPDELRVGTILRGTGALRYSLADNLALHGEYSYRTQESRSDVSDVTEHFGTLRLDWGF